jgi:hypothetical protein
VLHEGGHRGHNFPHVKVDVPMIGQLLVRDAFYHLPYFGGGLNLA